MAKVAYTNTTDGIQHIGPVRVDPGMTREVDDVYLRQGRPPRSHPSPPEDDDPLDYVRELADDNVSAIRNAVPNLRDDELEELQRLEAERARPRVSVSEMVTAEQLNRAAD